MKRVAGAVIVSLMMVFSVAGCAGELSASSTCQDFAEASPEEQQSAISSLSSEFETPDYTTPLGEPAVGYYCASNPDTTLEEFFVRAQEE